MDEERVEAWHAAEGEDDARTPSSEESTDVATKRMVAMAPLYYCCCCCCVLHEGRAMGVVVVGEKERAARTI